MQTFLTFDSLQDARDYRYNNGTGGWIFEPTTQGQVILFPPDFTPCHIFTHALTTGQSGKLYANAYAVNAHGIRAH